MSERVICPHCKKTTIVFSDHQDDIGWDIRKVKDLQEEVRRLTQKFDELHFAVPAAKPRPGQVIYVWDLDSSKGYYSAVFERFVDGKVETKSGSLWSKWAPVSSSDI